MKVATYERGFDYSDLVQQPDNSRLLSPVMLHQKHLFLGYAGKNWMFSAIS